jgi:tRNA (guanine37-N1)-methyltransferase
MSTAQGRKSGSSVFRPRGRPSPRRPRSGSAGTTTIGAGLGHYEGIDERFIEASVDEEISLGDFV